MDAAGLAGTSDGGASGAYFLLCFCVACPGLCVRVCARIFTCTRIHIRSEYRQYRQGCWTCAELNEKLGKLKPNNAVWRDDMPSCSEWVCADGYVRTSSGFYCESLPRLMARCRALTRCARCAEVSDCVWCPAGNGGSGVCLAGMTTADKAGCPYTAEGKIGSDSVSGKCECQAATCSDECKHSSCGACVSDEYCGWCAGTERCMLGSYFRPAASSCPAGTWIPHGKTGCASDDMLWIIGLVCATGATLLIALLGCYVVVRIRRAARHRQALAEGRAPEQLELRNRTQRLLAAMPTFRFRAVEKGSATPLGPQEPAAVASAADAGEGGSEWGEEEGDAPMCSICLGDFGDGEECRMLPCLHAFHASCIDQWLRISHECPLCKRSVIDPASADVHSRNREFAEAQSTLFTHGEWGARALLQAAAAAAGPDGRRGWRHRLLPAGLRSWARGGRPLSPSRRVGDAAPETRAAAMLPPGVEAGGGVDGGAAAPRQRALEVETALARTAELAEALDADGLNVSVGWSRAGSAGASRQRDRGTPEATPPAVFLYPMADDSAHPLNYPLFRRSPLELPSLLPPPPRQADGGESAAAHEDSASEDSTSDDDDAVDTVRALGPRTEPLAAAPDSAAHVPAGGAGARGVPAAHTRAAPAGAYYSTADAYCSAAPFAVEPQPASGPPRLVLPSHSVPDSPDYDGGARWEGAGARARATRAEAGDDVLPMRPVLDSCPAEPDAGPVPAGSPATGSARRRSLAIDDVDDDDKDGDGSLAGGDVGDGLVWGGGQVRGPAAGVPDAWQHDAGVAGEEAACPDGAGAGAAGGPQGGLVECLEEADEEGTGLDICV